MGVKGSRMEWRRLYRDIGDIDIRDRVEKVRCPLDERISRGEEKEGVHQDRRSRTEMVV